MSDNIDLNILIEKTVQYMSENNIDDLPLDSPRAEDNVWSKIAKFCDYPSNFKTYLSIKMRWLRDSFNFRSIVKKKLTAQISNECEQFSNDNISKYRIFKQVFI